MTSQSEERAAYIAALADQRSAPMQMLPLCIPAPPQPVAPPAPPKVSVAAQTTQDQENRKEHEAFRKVIGGCLTRNGVSAVCYLEDGDNACDRHGFAIRLPV
eukprot:symbB.v1.2.013524.t2/scaffold795.1/size259473/16